MLNFNYKFREVNSIAYNLKEYENIKIQSSAFKNVKDISSFIKEITGSEDINEEANIGNERFFVYSYACLDQKDWNETTKEEDLDSLFTKYRSVLPYNSQILDDKYTRSTEKIDDKKIMYKNQYIKYGFTPTSTVLFTSNINTSNFTVVPQKFESEYLYTYLIVLYKKILLNKLNYSFRNKYKKAEEGLIDFTKQLWIQDITNEEFGKKMEEAWTENLGIESMYAKIKGEYDVSYKKHNVEEMNKNNKITRAIILAILVINFLTILYVSLK